MNQRGVQFRERVMIASECLQLPGLVGVDKHIRARDQLEEALPLCRRRNVKDDALLASSVRIVVERVLA